MNPIIHRDRQALLPASLALPPAGLPQIRPLAPHDAALVGEFLHALSPASRRRRFHFGVREFAPELLRRYALIDPGHEVALIATVHEGGRTRCVGEARYAALEREPDSREFAIAVLDEGQRRGLGTALLEQLLQHARRAGVRWLQGDVLRDNKAMLALAGKLGFAVQRHPDDATLVRLIRATTSRSLQ